MLPDIYRDRDDSGLHLVNVRTGLVVRARYHTWCKSDETADTFAEGLAAKVKLQTLRALVTRWRDLTEPTDEGGGAILRRCADVLEKTLDEGS